MYLKVVITPSARREKVTEDGKALRIEVREPAERNLANTRVREIVAERLGVSVKQVRIINGHQSRSKLLSVQEAR